MEETKEPIPKTNEEDSLTIRGVEVQEFVQRLRDLPKGDEVFLIRDDANGIVIKISSKKYDAEELGNYALQTHKILLDRKIVIKISDYIG